MRRINPVDIIIMVLAVGLIFTSITEVNINPKEAVESHPEIKLKEKDYVNQYCKGIKEYTLPDRTRIDCLTDEYAIEFDYAKKWAESIGQSLYYAKKTGKKPAVAIIMSCENDRKYIKRIQDTDKDITIFEIWQKN